MAPAIQVKNLLKDYRVKKPATGFGGFVKSLFRPEYEIARAVDNISFDLQPGERVAFIGPNGAGKSTTIKILSGILQPTAGEVSVLGFTPWRQRRQMAYKIGTVFGQRSQLWQHLPARDTFSLLASAYEIEQDAFTTRLKELGDAFDIAPFLDKPVRQLSLGQRMRCEIVASLLHNPEVLFLDEPTVGLDVAAKGVIRDLISRASAVEGTTVLLTSHDTGDMERVCDRVIVIDQGHLMLDKEIETLRKSYIRRKILTLAMKEESITLDMEGVSILEQAPHKLKIAVHTARADVETVIQAAMRQSTLRDISVEDPPMEDIVKNIYKDSAGKGGAA